MYIDDLYLEVTRKCNFKCAHCLRGNAQNKSMALPVIYNLFSHVTNVRTLTLGGGEPSLATNTIYAILDAVRRYNVDIENIFMVTNGKRISLPLLDCFSQFLAHCSDNSISGFSISNDIYHTEQRGFVQHTDNYIETIMEHNYKPNQIRFIEIPEEMIHEHTDENTSNWFARGRAKNWGQRHDEYLDNLKLDSLEHPTTILGSMYVCHDGRVLGDANMAYNDMKPFIRGNILEWDTLIDNLKTSTIENYHWCKNNCSHWEDCNDWNDESMALHSKQQIEKQNL